MTPFREMVDTFLGDVMATCPEGFELGEMHVENAADVNQTKLVVTWKPGAALRSGAESARSLPERPAS